MSQSERTRGAESRCRPLPALFGPNNCGRHSSGQMSSPSTFWLGLGFDVKRGVQERRLLCKRVGFTDRPLEGLELPIERRVHVQSVTFFCRCPMSGNGRFVCTSVCLLPNKGEFKSIHVLVPPHSSLSTCLPSSIPLGMGARFRSLHVLCAACMLQIPTKGHCPIKNIGFA